MKEQNNLEKKIKRNVYGKPQSVLIVFPAGLADIARKEAQFILDHLWFQNKFASQITVLKNVIRIDQIHLFAVIELMLRGQCFTDIRLIISEGKLINMAAFEKYCGDIDWEFYLTNEMSLKVKVDVGASPALHEGAMKEILTNGLTNMVSAIVSGENTEATTLLHLDVFKHHSIMSISLAGELLYKRAYRSVLSHSAPLREDIAACCLKKALQFIASNQPDYICDKLLIPFSGTGTFLFEYWISHYQFVPAFFDRTYAIQAMPLYRSDHFNFLMKKARENCCIEQLIPDHFYCVDNAKSANVALISNIENFKQAVEKNQFAWKGTEDCKWLLNEDFLKIDLDAVFKEVSGNIFIPINPPYGIRFGNSNETLKLYEHIASQINALSTLLKKRGKHAAGFILCPGEASWSAFCKTLSGAIIDTYHLTQGGLDIRVAQFYTG